MDTAQDNRGVELGNSYANQTGKMTQNQVSDNQPPTWLSRFAQLLEKLAFSGVPQSFTHLRKEVIGMVGHTWTYSLPGALCLMYLMEVRAQPGRVAGWQASGFLWEEYCNFPDGIHGTPCLVLYELPAPVMWWAIKETGGYETALLVNNYRETGKFAGLAKQIREIDRYYKQIGKEQYVMATRNTPDQTMKNTLRLQQKAKPKPKTKFDF